jgi:hypothetical protein
VPATPAAALAGAARSGPGFGRAAAPQLILDLRAAWRTTRGRGVTVAILGGAVDPQAAGLAGKVTTGPVYGNPALVPATNGTLVASAVAGGGPNPANPSGTLGLAPGARILSVRVATPATAKAAASTWPDNMGRAIRYAAARGAGVIYVDQLAYADSAALDAAVGYAIARNVIVVSDEYATSASSRTLREYPAGLPGVLGAATVSLPGLTPSPKRYPTPANDSILVAAPGNVMQASGPGGVPYQVYSYYAASAWLTATAALIKAAYPHLPPVLAARALAVSARHHPRGGYRPSVGFGLINPAGALREAGKLQRVPMVAVPGRNAADPGAHLLPADLPGLAPPGQSELSLARAAGKFAGGIALVILAFVVRARWRPRPQRARPRRD